MNTFLLVYIILVAVILIFTCTYINKIWKRKDERMKLVDEALSVIRKAESQEDVSELYQVLDKMEELANSKEEFENAKVQLLELFDKRLRYVERSRQQQLYFKNLIRRY